MRPLRPVEAQWLFEYSALHATPSQADETSYETELQRRKSAVEYMRSLARRTNLSGEDPQDSASKGVMTVGSTLLHRFYMRRTLTDFPERLIAPTILFLASKIEEQPLKLRHIVNACLDKFEINAVPWHPSENKDVRFAALSLDLRLMLAPLAISAINYLPSMGERHSRNGGDRTRNTVFRHGSRATVDYTAPECPRARPSLVTASFRPERSRETSIQGQRQVVRSSHLRHCLGVSLRIVHPSFLVSTWLTPLSHSSPLCILHHSIIIAYSLLALLFGVLDRIPMSQAFALAAELAWKFDLNIEFDEQGGAIGSDQGQVQDCLERIKDFCKLGLIDPKLTRHIIPEPDSPTPSFRRRLVVRNPPPENNHSTTGHNTPLPSSTVVSPEPAGSLFGDDDDDNELNRDGLANPDRYAPEPTSEMPSSTPNLNDA
ncbi:hypothetical protein P7C73_g4427, partial [Tremellales sp. Uapishka_1]